MLMPLVVALSLAAPSTIRADDPPIQLWIDPDHALVRGDRVRVHVRAAEDAYVVVLRVDAEGRVRALFPLDPGDDDFVRGGERQEVRGRSNREAFFIDERKGGGTVLAAAAKSPFKFDEFVRGDHWDYRVLASDQARDDPEAVLLDIVRRMAGDEHFDYDVATYTVMDVAQRPYGYRPYGFGYGAFGYGGYGYRGYGYGGYGFGLGFGSPFYYCDPFFDSFCDPFFYGYGYDPFYYGGLRYGYCWWCGPRVYAYSNNWYRPAARQGFLARFRQTRPSSPPFVLPSNPVTRRSVPPAIITRPPVEERPRDVRPADRPPERRAPNKEARPADRPSERRGPDRAAPPRDGGGRSNGGQARPRTDTKNHMDFFPQRSFSSPPRSMSGSRPDYSPRSGSSWGGSRGGGGGGGGSMRSMTRGGGGGSRSGGGGRHR